MGRPRKNLTKDSVDVNDLNVVTGVALDFQFNEDERKYYLVYVNYDSTGKASVEEMVDIGGNQAIALSKLQDHFTKKMMKMGKRKR